MDFSSIRGITIPEGVVKCIKSGAVTLWQAVSGVLYSVFGASRVEDDTIKGVGDYDSASGKYNMPIVASSRNIFNILRSEYIKQDKKPSSTRALNENQYILGFAWNGYQQGDGTTSVEITSNTLSIINITAPAYGVGIPFRVETNRTYCVSVQNLNNASFVVGFFTEDGVFTDSYAGLNLSSTHKVTFVVTDTTAKWAILRISNINSGDAVVEKLCINVSDSLNGEYTPYSAPHTYPCKISAPLVKIGTIADQADYETQTITRRIGKVDLGQANISYSGQLFTVILTDLKPPQSTTERQLGILCGVYGVDSQRSVSYASMSDKKMLRYSSNVYIKDTSFTSVEDFKRYNNGKYLYYELVTPTTEDADLPTIEEREGMVLTTNTEVQGEITIN